MATWLWIPSTLSHSKANTLDANNADPFAEEECDGGVSLLPGSDRETAAHAPQQQHTPRTLANELRLCLWGPVKAARLLTFGLLIGVSLLLQGMNQFILNGVGFSAKDAGIGNCLYQVCLCVCWK